MSNARELAQIPSTPSGRRNLIINGAMTVAQRGTSISITNTTGYTLDRFKIGRGSNYNFDVDVSQSSDAPTDFANSLKIDVQATATPSASDNATLEYFIEGQDLTHLNYGSSSGKYVVLSFWVKSNKTGTYGCQFKLDSNSRNFTNSYTISSSNTWEKKTITINPDTAGAAFADNNLVGARIIWHLSTGPDDILSGNRDWTADALFRSVTGQVNLLDSTSNEFYLTGVQLEVGTVATEFEHRSFGEELALCQRYYTKFDFPQTTPFFLSHKQTGNTVRSTVTTPVPMRTTPTINASGQPYIRYNWDSGSNLIIDDGTSLTVIGSSLDANRFTVSNSDVTSVGNNVGAVLAYAGDLECDSEL
jgi:hypothetical protein